MAFDELKENFMEADARVRSYLGQTADYYQLKGFKLLMKGVTTFSKLLLIGMVGTMALLFLSLAASFGIGQALDNTFYGFLCVGGFYVLVCLLVYALRRKLEKPLLKKFSEYYFEES